MVISSVVLAALAVVNPGSGASTGQTFGPLPAGTLGDGLRGVLQDGAWNEANIIGLLSTVGLPRLDEPGKALLALLLDTPDVPVTVTMDAGESQAIPPRTPLALQALGFIRGPISPASLLGNGDPDLQGIALLSLMSPMHENQARRIMGNAFHSAFAQSNQHNRFNPLRQAITAAEAKLDALGESSALRRAGRATMYAALLLLDQNVKGAVPDELYAGLKPE